MSETIAQYGKQVENFMPRPYDGMFVNIFSVLHYATADCIIIQSELLESSPDTKSEWDERGPTMGT